MLRGIAALDSASEVVDSFVFILNRAAERATRDTR
jgi:hypothetical protein